MRDDEKPDSALLLPREHPQSEQVADALARVRAARTLPDAFEAWLRLRTARAEVAAQRARELEQIERRAGFVVGSVGKARELPPGPAAPKARGRKRALAGGDALSGFLEQAERELAAARRGLARRARDEERFFEDQLARVRDGLFALVEAALAHHRPRVAARVQTVGREHALVHLRRLSDVDAVLLSHLLSGRLPTRYDAFSDDSVDEVGLEPARFYAEEGLDRTRFASVEEEDAVALDPTKRVVAVKGMICFEVPGHAFPRFRLVNRGPLAEVQARERGGEYGHLLPRASAELFSALLVRLQVGGRIDLSLEVA